MIKFNKDQILLYHQLISQQTGGAVGVRDAGLLDSALESAYQTFDGKEFFPTKQEKAAKLGYSLISNHAFMDGNKRIGMHVMISFLNLGGIYLDAQSDEIIRVGMEVAEGKMKYEDLLKWIKENQTR
jgi:death-on-curing family protein